MKRFYQRGDRSQLPPELEDRVETILGRLDAAKDIKDMDIHSYRLHRLKGAMKRFWAVTVRVN